jgi:hypothetical protein
MIRYLTILLAGATMALTSCANCGKKSDCSSCSSCDSKAKKECCGKGGACCKAGAHKH